MLNANKIFNSGRNLVLTLTLAVSTLSHAGNPWGTDFSDMWWNPSESGWGANMTHQDSIIFLTLYHYGDDGKARWHSGALNARGTGVYVFDGDLYESTGPFYGTPGFNAAAVSARKVGSATVDLTQINTGILTYTIDGVTITKAVERFTFRKINLSGSYTGGVRELFDKSGGKCQGESSVLEESVQFSVIHNPTNDDFLLNADDCIISGKYSQSGKLGKITGLLICRYESSNFEATEIETTSYSMSMKFRTNSQTCSSSGRLSVVKRD